MDGGLLDDPELIAAAATDVGLDRTAVAVGRLAGRGGRAAGGHRAARDPSPAARALDHKLGGPPQRAALHGTELRVQLAGRTFSMPGFNPVEAYEAAIANLGADAGPAPEAQNVTELLPGRRAAGDGRGRGDHGPTRRAPSWPRRDPDPGRRGLLLEAAVM